MTEMTVLLYNGAAVAEHRRNQQRNKVENRTVPAFLESGFYLLALLAVVAHVVNKQHAGCLRTT